MTSIERCFKEYYLRLTVFAYPYVASEDIAKDIVQDAFMILVDRSDILSKDESIVKSFLYSTVKNLCLNFIRREHIGERIVKEITLPEVDESDHLQNIIHAEVVGKLYKELNDLPEKCQHICRLLYFEGKKYEEVAQLLDLSVNTVKSQRQRALRLLRSKLLQIIMFFF